MAVYNGYLLGLGEVDWQVGDSVTYTQFNNTTYVFPVPIRLYPGTYRIMLFGSRTINTASFNTSQRVMGDLTVDYPITLFVMVGNYALHLNGGTIKDIYGNTINTLHTVNGGAYQARSYTSGTTNNNGAYGGGY